MNKDTTIMSKILFWIGVTFLVFIFAKTTLIIIALIFFRAMYIQRYDYAGFLRKIKYTFKLRL